MSENRTYSIPVAELDVREGYHTIWVNGPDGGTVLRIKCTGKVKIREHCENICAHADLIVSGDIEICMPEKS
jgi:hypothetical protein